MSRVRVSTTVDEERLAAARRLLDLPPSKLLDRALDALRREIETENEAAAFRAFPYEDDPDVSWETAPGPVLPYDGEIPADVLRLAEQRRERER
ncbi:MAG: hypothetical protein IT198_04945 [Acidimicrobiia bacterium]|nr:hypothetical protein [Acidimicrobiia bacterium]